MSKACMCGLTDQARRRLQSLLESPDDSVALLAAIEIMDRADGRECPRAFPGPGEAVEVTVSVKPRRH